MKLLQIAALASVVALAACTPTAQTQEASPSPVTEVMTETSPVVSPTSMTETDTEARVVEVKANDFTYDVKEIKAKQGEKVTVSFTNTEGFHDFVVDELNVNSGMVPVGQTVELDIPTDKPGEYFFYCSVGNHRERGMEGKLIIE